MNHIAVVFSAAAWPVQGSLVGGKGGSGSSRRTDVLDESGKLAEREFRSVTIVTIIGYTGKTSQKKIERLTLEADMRSNVFIENNWCIIQ